MTKSTEWFLSRARLLISSHPKLQLLFIPIGILLIALGLFFANKLSVSNSNIEVLQTPSNSVLSPPKSNADDIIVDVEGAIQNPGIYHLSSESRVEDALVAAGGLSADADRSWVDKNLDRAAKMIDGQKIFVPLQQSNVLGANVAQSTNASDSNLVNINSASLGELETLNGIGQVHGQNIIDNRPYSDVSDLLSKKILTQSVYDKIKDKISVY